MLVPKQLADERRRTDPRVLHHVDVQLDRRREIRLLRLELLEHRLVRADVRLHACDELPPTKSLPGILCAHRDHPTLFARHEFDELPGRLDVLRTRRDRVREPADPRDERVLLVREPPTLEEAIIGDGSRRDPEIQARHPPRDAVRNPVAVDLHRDFARVERVVLVPLERSLELLGRLIAAEDVVPGDHEVERFDRGRRIQRTGSAIRRDELRVVLERVHIQPRVAVVRDKAGPEEVAVLVLLREHTAVGEGLAPGAGRPIRVETRLAQRLSLLPENRAIVVENAIIGAGRNRVDLALPAGFVPGCRVVVFRPGANRVTVAIPGDEVVERTERSPARPVRNGEPVLDDDVRGDLR